MGCGAVHSELKDKQRQEQIKAKGVWKDRPSATAVDTVKDAATEAYIRSGGTAHVFVAVLRTDVKKDCIKTFGEYCDIWMARALNI